MRRRNLFCLAVLLLSLGTTLILPATGWLARREARTAVGIVDPAAYGISVGDAAARDDARLAAIVAAEPADFDLAYAVALRQAGSNDRIPDALESLKARFPERPELYAHQLRYWTRGPLNLKQREPDKRSDADPEPGVATREVWERAEQTAARGASLDPDNAFFPLMQAMALLAQGKDEAGYEALHTAAQCPHYQDYIWQEAQAVWKRSDRLNGGESGSLPKLAQQSALLFPHYATIRSLARVASAEATRRESQGDTAGALSLRHDIAVVGGRLRDDGESIITNLVGIAIVFIAPSGVPAWEMHEKYSKDEDTQRRQSMERVARYQDYLNGLNTAAAKAEARSFAAEVAASLEAKRLIRRATNSERSGFDGPDGLMAGTMRAAAAQAVGVLLLINLGWFLFIGAGAALLRRTRGVRNGEGLSLRVPAALIGVALGIGILAVTLFQLRGLAPILGLSSALTSTEEGSSARLLLPLTLLALSSVSVPLVTLLVLAVRGKVKREHVLVATVRGMRGVALPMAAVLGVLFAGLALWTVGQEKQNLSRMGEMVTMGEAAYYFRAAGMAWPVGPGTGNTGAAGLPTQE